MPQHQRPIFKKPAAQNAATDPTAPQTAGSNAPRSDRPEPKSYTAPDARDATLAGPASGEVGEYADEGDPIDPRYAEVQTGGDRNNIASKDIASPQGRKTVEANRAKLKRGPGTEGARRG
jgi:hypothetical protein